MALLCRASGNAWLPDLEHRCSHCCCWRNVHVYFKGRFALANAMVGNAQNASTSSGLVFAN
eukprot:scaffold510871_cov30-Prasinocladus_malaysianus.AAC.1